MSAVFNLKMAEQRSPTVVTAKEARELMRAHGGAVEDKLHAWIMRMVAKAAPRGQRIVTKSLFPWSEGAIDTKAIVRRLRKQGFSVEIEKNNHGTMRNSTKISVWW